MITYIKIYEPNSTYVEFWPGQQISMLGSGGKLIEGIVEKIVAEEGSDTVDVDLEGGEPSTGANRRGISYYDMPWVAHWGTQA